MPGSSAFHQNKHKGDGQIWHNPTMPGFCLKCEKPKPRAEIFKGWCVSCVSAWNQTADLSLIRRDDPVLPEPPTLRAYDRLKARIAERRSDEWFIPMTLYIGNYTIGQAQANWNYLQALYELEVATSQQAFLIGKESHDLLHICGRHAAMQPSSLGSFIARVIHSPEVWRDVEPHMQDYIQTFVAENRAIASWANFPRRRIDRFASDQIHKVRRSYRIDPNRKSKSELRAEQRQFDLKYKFVSTPTPNFWPFAVRQAPTEHEMLTAIDQLTRGVPEQWRQDVCQDLVVSVLSGEVTLGNLQDALPQHLKHVFEMHPIKYGDVSLDAPISGDGPRTLHELIAQAPQETDDREEDDDCSHRYDGFATGGWHEGWDRPVGLARVGDVLRHKHGGRAIE